jgi:hypothetical protein
VYATGTVGRHGRLRLTATRKLRTGRYALRLVQGSVERRVAVRVVRS